MLRRPKHLKNEVVASKEERREEQEQKYNYNSPYHSAFKKKT